MKKSTEPSTPLAAINGTMTLSQIDGQFQITNIDRDPFPSLEVYSYQDSQYDYTLATLTEDPLGPFWGLNPIAFNEIYHTEWNFWDGYGNLNDGSTIYPR